MECACAGQVLACMCLNVCVLQEAGGFVRMACFPPFLMFSFCERNSVDEIPNFSGPLFFPVPGEVS